MSRSKVPFFVVIAIFLLAFIFALTPMGMWILSATVSVGNEIILRVVAYVFIIALIATFPWEGRLKRTAFYLCMAIACLAAFQILNTIDFGGNFYGLWGVARHARIDGFNITDPQDSQNTAFYFAEDGTLTIVVRNDNTVTSSTHTWHIIEGRREQAVNIMGVPYEFRFSHFGRRVTLERIRIADSGPNIPHMTRPRDMQVVLRRP